VFVCVCNAYRESQVRDAIKKSGGNSAITVEQVYARLGSGPRCGRCVHHVKNMIDSRPDKQAAEAARL
jgi:bacterioferritin-associated ferredoxin